MGRQIEERKVSQKLVATEIFCFVSISFLLHDFSFSFKCKLINIIFHFYSCASHSKMYLLTIDFKLRHTDYLTFACIVSIFPGISETLVIMHRNPQSHFYSWVLLSFSFFFFFLNFDLPRLKSDICCWNGKCWMFIKSFKIIPGNRRRGEGYMHIYERNESVFLLSILICLVMTMGQLLCLENSGKLFLYTSI